jgi:hypothetical protein
MMKSPAVFMLSGIVTVDDKPVEAKIKIDITDKNIVFREFTSNSAKGNYLVNLPPGANYKVTYSYNGFASQDITIEALTLNSYTEKVVNINFTIPKDTLSKVDSLLAKTDTVKSEAVSKETVLSVEGLEFKVQIAAYNLPKNYKYGHLKGLGTIEKLVLDDGITRFTIGGAFKTLDAASEHKGKVRTAGQKDAFVTAIYNGKRVYLEDLEKLGLIAPQVK